MVSWHCAVPGVVVRHVVVLPKEGVEPPVSWEEGLVTVAEVPFAHQGGAVAALPQQLRQEGHATVQSGGLVGRYWVSSIQVGQVLGEP